MNKELIPRPLTPKGEPNFFLDVSILCELFFLNGILKIQFTQIARSVVPLQGSGVLNDFD